MKLKAVSVTVSMVAFETLLPALNTAQINRKEEFFDFLNFLFIQRFKHIDSFLQNIIR